MCFMNGPPRPVVRYRTDKPHIISVGRSALVYPMAHPSPDVTGDGETPVLTSPVCAYNDETGEFSTLNTDYKPVQEG